MKLKMKNWNVSLESIKKIKIIILIIKLNPVIQYYYNLFIYFIATIQIT